MDKQITIDKSYFEESNKPRKIKLEWVDYMSTVNTMLRMQQEIFLNEHREQEQNSPVENEELDKDLEDNVENADEPAGGGSWTSGEDAVSEVESETIKVKKKFRFSW